ncbi:MAG: hypothetical protein ABIZ30_05130, partial [Candidatus Limnocylindrales bacterium]
MRIPNQFRDSAPALLAILLVAGAALDAAMVSNPASFDGPILEVPAIGPVDHRSAAANRPQPTADRFAVEPAEDAPRWRPGPLHP